MWNSREKNNESFDDRFTRAGKIPLEDQSYQPSTIWIGVSNTDYIRLSVKNLPGYD